MFRSWAHKQPHLSIHERIHASPGAQPQQRGVQEGRDSLAAVCYFFAHHAPRRAAGLKQLTELLRDACVVAGAALPCEYIWLCSNEGGQMTLAVLTLRKYNMMGWNVSKTVLGRHRHV